MPVHRYDYWFISMYVHLLIESLLPEDDWKIPFECNNKNKMLFGQPI